MPQADYTVGRFADEGGAVHNLVSRIFGGWSNPDVFDLETALRNAAAFYANGAASGTLVIPPGDYTLDSYRVTGGPGANGVDHIRWTGVRGLAIEGRGARIHVKGDFARDEDVPILNANGQVIGYSAWNNQVCPFLFERGDGIAIHGVEVDGNVDEMTRQSALVGEQGENTGFIFYGCSNVSLTDTYAHHWAADGYYLGDISNGTGVARAACRNAVMSNCRGLYNARDGLSPIQVRGMTVFGGHYGHTGGGGGAYGWHSPGSCVDVEPNRTIQAETAAGVPFVDVKTGDLTFLSTRFTDSAGWAFVSSVGPYVENLRLIGCEVDVGEGAVLEPTSLHGMQIQCIGGLVQDCAVNLRNRRLTITRAENQDARNNTHWRRCSFLGSGIRMLIDSHGDPAYQNERYSFDECSFAWHVPTAVTAPMVQITNRAASFRRCRFFANAAAHDGTGYHIATQLDVDYCEHNEFSTDLSNPGLHFATLYGASTTVRNDRYPSGNAYRETPNSARDPLQPFSQGAQNVGPAYLHGTLRNLLGTVAPTTGTWARGDKVWNTSTLAGGNVGWVCTTAGTPGTWKSFGTIAP